jgi:uncharacterized protein (DUF1684 family)
MTRDTRYAAALLAGFVVAATAALGARLDRGQAQDAYVQDVERRRQAHEAALEAPDGLLSVIGIAGLNGGANGAGSADGSAVALPAGAPASVGTFRLEKETVSFDAAPGAGVRVNGRTPRPGQVLSYEGRPDTVTVGDLTLSVVTSADVERGRRFGIQIRDAGSAARRAFTGLTWWPVNEAFRIEATFVPYVPEKHATIINDLGDLHEGLMAGRLNFAIGTRKLRLDVSWAPGEDGILFAAFRDRTSGNGSYDPGRYLTAAFPGGRKAADALAAKAADGGTAAQVTVTLDFNRAYNPPCAFTPYSPCPLPPKQNWLPATIEAGERLLN